MGHARSSLTRRATFAVAGLLIAGMISYLRVYPTSPSVIASESPSQDLPRIEAMFAKPLTEPSPVGNALLTVRFRDYVRPDQFFAIPFDGQLLILRDDGMGSDNFAGDGLFSAIVDLDFQQLRQNRERVRALHASLGERFRIPAFEGRLKVAEKEFNEVEPLAIQADQSTSLLPLGTPAAVDSAKSLLITDTRVVEDPSRTFNPCAGSGTPMGKWTFGRLVEQMVNQQATGIDPSDFVREWLSSWQDDQTVNGLPVARRAKIKKKIIKAWPKLPSGKLDLSRAPFKLLAIVNRVDLRGSITSGNSNAGEGRFVFGALDRNCLPFLFTVIIEYGVKRDGCEEVKAWARKWFDLGALELGSPDYNAALEAITEQFVRSGADLTKPNGSALNQIRTNEIALAPFWEMREFEISPQGKLQQVAVAQTPDDSLNRSSLLVDYINANEADILTEKNVVPGQFAGSPFLGGASGMASASLFWNNPQSGQPIADRKARHLFSLQTCNGCHSGETRTSFTHISPAPFGVRAALSPFLTGVDVPDPADGSPTRRFSDLERRAMDLDQLVNSPCLSQLAHRPLKAQCH